MKKRGKGWFAVLLAVGLLALTAPEVSAESNATYERNYGSNGVVGFFGTYISPEEEEVLEEENIPATPVKPASPIYTGKGGDQITHNVASGPAVQVNKIPQTGDESPWQSWGISLLFMMGAILFLSKYKNQKSKEEIV